MSENSQRGQYDPGWNDPPKLQYQTASTGSGKTKLNLNKRVAFPLQQGSVAVTSKPTAIVQPSPSISLPTVTTSQPPVAIVQPLMSQTPPPPMRVPTIPIDSRDDDNESGNADNFSNLDDVRDYCINTFQTYLSHVEETPNVRIDEVQRRINLLSQMWLNNTLNFSVHRKLFNIAKALESKHFTDAMENHRAIVVDHSNVCTSWAPALRQIILTIQDNNPCTVTNAINNISSTGTTTSSIFTPVAPTQTVVINPFVNILVPTSTTTDSETTTTITSSSSSSSTINSSSISDNNSTNDVLRENSLSSSNVQHL